MDISASIATIHLNDCYWVLWQWHTQFNLGVGFRATLTRMPALPLSCNVLLSIFVISATSVTDLRIPAEIAFWTVKLLKVGGEAIVQLADVYASRANALLDAWERSQSSLGPVLSPQGLADLLIRQSMRVDLSDLIQVPDYKYVRSERLSFSNGKILVGSEQLEQTVPFMMFDQSSRLMPVMAEKRYF